MGNLEDLARYRDALLLAEIAAWLHMFSKFHEDFLTGDHGIDVKIPDEVKAPDYKELYGLLTASNWTGSLWGRLPDQRELRAKGLSINDLIKRHRPPNANHEGFVRLMQDAHGRGSGVEKGLLVRSTGDNKEPAYLSTSFGYEIALDNVFIKRGCIIFCVSGQAEKRMKRKIEGERDDHSTRIDRRTAQRMRRST